MFVRKKEREAHKETHNKLINTQRIMNEIPFRIFSKKFILKHFVLNSIYIPVCAFQETLI